MVDNYDDMLSRFHKYQRVTDGRTDGWTDRITISISRVSLLMRDKNGKKNFTV